MKGEIAQERWISAGLAELAKSGIEGVRVEVLAKELGVTKGGFYWHFKDRDALLEGILEKWKHGRIAAIEEQTKLGDETARERLKAVIKLFAGRVNAQGMAIELAIRQWARSDKAATAAVARVDDVRLRSVARLYHRLGFSEEHADAQAFLFYSFIFGQSLLFLGQGSRKLGNLTAACANILTDVEKAKSRNR